MKNYDWTNITNGPNFFGDTYNWNLTVNSLTNTSINYSISTGGGDYKLSSNFIIGLD